MKRSGSINYMAATTHAHNICWKSQNGTERDLSEFIVYLFILPVGQAVLVLTVVWSFEADHTDGRRLNT